MRKDLLNASGGTGKIYTISLILTKLRSQRKIALATAMSGTAAILLHNGRTQHSQRKVSLDIKVECTCNCAKRDATGKLMQSAHLFLFIDEVSSGHGHISESVDRSLQDVRKNKTHFSGLTYSSLVTGNRSFLSSITVAAHSVLRQP